MKLRKTLTSLLLAGMLPVMSVAQNDPPSVGEIVSIVELDIDSTHLEAFKAALIEEMNDSIRLEPGVYAIHAVAHKNDPAKFMFFEIYASRKALQEHRSTPHFRKFLDITKDMVLARRIVENDVVHLSAKP